MGPGRRSRDTYAAYRVICEGVGGGAVAAADSVAKVVIGLMGAWDPPPGAALPAITATPVTPSTKPVAKPTASAVKPAPATKPPPAKARLPSRRPDYLLSWPRIAPPPNSAL
jgi:hypothetical protein